MKAARKISTLVLVLLAIAGISFAQEHRNGNLAERQKAPTVLGGTGLFNTFSTRTLCKGEFNFALFWNNFDRDPGDIDINQVPFNFTIGLTNRWELWVNWITWTNTTSRQPFLLSGYQYNTVRNLGDPFVLLGPPIGGGDGAAYFPRTGPNGGAIFGGILPTVGAFGAPIGFDFSFVTPTFPGAPFVRGVGPLVNTNLPSYWEELPFFGEVDFVGFDAFGRPIFGARQSSNGSGDIFVGTKVNLIDPNKNWFSMALGGYLKIPISRSDHARARGRTSGELEYGPVLMFGQESGGKVFRLYENIGYIHTGDIEEGDFKVLDLRDKLLFNIGTGIALGSHAEFVGELVHTHFIGGGTPSLIRNNPWDLNLGLRFFFKNGAISFGGAYRRFLNNEDDITLPVFRSTVVFVPPFFIQQPLFDTVNQTFPSEGGNGFVAYFSIGRRKECPPPPAPTCTLAPSVGTVNRGERLSLTVTPTTPGWDASKVTYDYRWEIRDASGRPVTPSGSGASVDVATTGIPCGRYSVTTTVTATVPAVDCPSECVTTGQTTCTTSFEVTEPPCPSVTCEIVATPSSVTEGDRITLRVNASGADGATFNWTVSGGGQLSSSTGSEVTLDTTGLGLAPGSGSRQITVSVTVGTTRTRCDQPCPGGSCTATVTVNAPQPPPERPPISPCGPIFFPFNSARINNEHKACLDQIALQMQQDPRQSLVIDGHRDSSERVGISLTRANNARDYLVTEKGIDSARITVRNFGDTCPHESGDPNLNRRVEFWLIPEGGTIESIPKRCSGGGTGTVITTEEPAPNVEPRRRPTRRTPRRRARRPGEPVGMVIEQQQVSLTSIQ
jgi:OmpA family